MHSIRMWSPYAMLKLTQNVTVNMGKTTFKSDCNLILNVCPILTIFHTLFVSHPIYSNVDCSRSHSCEISWCRHNSNRFRVYKCKLYKAAIGSRSMWHELFVNWKFKCYTMCGMHICSAAKELPKLSSVKQNVCSMRHEISNNSTQRKLLQLWEKKRGKVELSYLCASVNPIASMKLDSKTALLL